MKKSLSSPPQSPPSQRCSATKSLAEGSMPTISTASILCDFRILGFVDKQTGGWPSYSPSVRFKNLFKRIYELSGREILQFNHVLNGQKMDISTLSSGIYIAQLYDVHGLMFNQRIIK